jgi:ferritin
MSRTTKLISEELAAMLVAQAAHELKNYNLYNSFSNYFALEALSDLEEYFYIRAEEEKEHHDWILHYLSEADCRIIYPAIEENKEQKVTSIIDPFISTVKREIETTQLIYAIKNRALEEGDHMTSHWLDILLIKEQIEEENTSRMARAIMELDGDILLKSKRVLQLVCKQKP